MTDTLQVETLAFEDIVVEKTDSIGTIRINRPQVLNAMRRQTTLEIREALENLRKDPEIRVVILTATGPKAFSSGADVKGGMFSAKTTSVEALKVAHEGQALLDLIENYEKPVIAAVKGYAVGGGCELVLACDFIICSEDAQFGQPEINLGFIPGWGGSQRLARLLSRNKAKELVLTGDRIDAHEAHRIGLVNLVVPPEKLDEAAKEFASKLAEKSPIALKLGKMLVNRAYETDLATGLSLEVAAFSFCFSTDDLKEGLTAFSEKRKPRFRGS